MAKVICSRPNAPSVISGINFTSMGDGCMVSDDFEDQEQLAIFLSIDGYALVEEAPPPPPKKPAAPKKPAKQPDPVGDQKDLDMGSLSDT